MKVPQSVLLAASAAALALGLVPARAQPEEKRGRIEYPAPENRLDEPVSKKHEGDPLVEKFKEALRGSGLPSEIRPDYRKVYTLSYMQEHASPGLNSLKIAVDAKDRKGTIAAAEHLHALYSVMQNSMFATDARWWAFAQEGKQAVMNVRGLAYRGDNEKLLQANFAKAVESCYACHRVYGGPPEKFEEITRFKKDLKSVGPVPKPPEDPEGKKKK